MVLAEFVIPFFFTFAIVYGALEVSGSFKNKRVNVIIGLVLAFFAVSNPMTIGFINGIIPYAVILFVVVFFLGFIWSFFSGREGKRKPNYTLIVIIAALLLLFFSGDNPMIGGVLISGEDIAPWVILILILLIFLGAYYKGSGSSN